MTPESECRTSPAALACSHSRRRVGRSTLPSFRVNRQSRRECGTTCN
jgi:hypothetical protein